MVHPVSIKGFDSLESLAKEVGALRYDAMAKITLEIARDLQRQADLDLQQGKKKLARAGYKTARGYMDAYRAANEMMEISRKYMKSELENIPEIKI